MPKHRLAVGDVFTIKGVYVRRFPSLWRFGWLFRLPQYQLFKFILLKPQLERFKVVSMAESSVDCVALRGCEEEEDYNAWI